VSLLLAKLRFHRHHREFNGLFDYEEYVTLKKIDDPNEGYEVISDLMQLQDQIDSFQKLIFAHFRGSTNNECRISALVPLVKESYGIYRFITSMMRALHRRTLSLAAVQSKFSRQVREKTPKTRLNPFELASQASITTSGSSTTNAPTSNTSPP
jgi:hypothetical protein